MNNKEERKQIEDEIRNLMLSNYHQNEEANMDKVISLYGVLLQLISNDISSAISLISKLNAPLIIVALEVYCDGLKEQNAETAKIAQEIKENIAPSAQTIFYQSDLFVQKE